MRFNEIASADDQLALWRLISDNVWSAVMAQAKKAEQAVDPVLREPQQFKDIRCIKTYQAILERIKDLEKGIGQSYQDYKDGRSVSFGQRKTHRGLLQGGVEWLYFWLVYF
jgi:hypothetical protein